MQIPAPQQPTAPAPVRSTIWDELTDDQWAKIEGRKTTSELAHEEAQAFAAEEAAYSTKASEGLWRDRKRLVCSCNAQFPPRCLKSNQPTNNRIQKRLSYCPLWAIILFDALIAMAFTRKMDVNFAMEQRWVTRRMIHALVGLGVALLGGLFMVIGGALTGSTDGEGAAETAGVLLFLLGVLPMCGGIIYALIGGRSVTVVYIDDMKQHAWLKGVHPDFLANLPQWSGPSH
jgi:hypothetical protein